MVRLINSPPSDTELLKSIRDQVAALRAENHIASLKVQRALCFLFGAAIGILVALLFK